MPKKKLSAFPKALQEGKSKTTAESENDASRHKLPVTFGGKTLSAAFNDLIKTGNKKLSEEEMRHGLVVFGICAKEEAEVIMRGICTKKEEAEVIMRAMSPDWKDSAEIDFEDFKLRVLVWGLRSVPCVLS